MKPDYHMLCERALRKLPHSYVPYSKFHVAAALLCEDGTIYEGINIENAAYAPTICAERAAVSQAVSNGHTKFRAIAIAGGRHASLFTDAYRTKLALPDFCPPCGVCRQVLREFGNPETFEIILAKSPDDYRVFLLKELLPMSFGPESL